MDWMNDLNWFAIQTKPHQERLAAARLAQVKLEVFLPRTRDEQPVCGSLRMVTKALFPGYFFVQFCPVLSVERVRHAPGVLRIVGSSRFPTRVEPEIITALRQRVQANGFIPLEPRSFRSGDKVQIGKGPLAGWLGRIEGEPDDHRRVAILLETIHQARILVDKRWVSLVEAA